MIRLLLVIAALMSGLLGVLYWMTDGTLGERRDTEERILEGRDVGSRPSDHGTQPRPIPPERPRTHEDVLIRMANLETGVRVLSIRGSRDAYLLNDGGTLPEKRQLSPTVLEDLIAFVVKLQDTPSQAAWEVVFDVGTAQGVKRLSSDKKASLLEFLGASPAKNWTPRSIELQLASDVAADPEEVEHSWPRSGVPPPDEFVANPKVFAGPLAARRSLVAALKGLRVKHGGRVYKVLSIRCPEEL